MSERREVTSDRFVHLHVHTEMSMLDGLDPPQKYVDRAVELGQPALAITDHGGGGGWPEHYHACRKAGIEPVLGEEFYYVLDAAWRPAKGSKEQPTRYHVTILARGAEGYKVLSELSTASHARFYHKPLLDDALLDSLGDAAEHLTVLSGCATSRLSRLLRQEEEEAARVELMKWREWFPHFYIELMHHDTSFDKRLNESLVDLARRYGLEWVITNDPHYVMEEDCIPHDALLAIQTASDLDDPDRFRFEGEGYHLRSRKEMYRAFRTYGDEVWKPGARNTLRVAKDCMTRIPAWETRTWQIPKYPDLDEEAGETSYSLLKKLTARGLRRKGMSEDPEAVAQAKHELKVFKQVGIEDFMLITWDCIAEARRRGIRVGPGRGSVCGTVVGYALDIHRIDPMKYGLRFDRFLNPERPRMPDIDSDFQMSRRDEMFEYAEEKYGRDNVMHVAAYQTMKAKSAFQSVAKAFGVEWADRQRITKEIAEDPETGEFTIPESLNEQYPELAKLMNRLSGTKRGYAAHPAGVIIASPEARIHEQVPEMWIPSGKGRWVGQYNLYAIEEMGLMKQDFLSLRTLDTIDVCLQYVQERTGEVIEPDEWVPDEEEGDEGVYAMLAAGDTSGVFQMEGPVNQRGCRAVQPVCFEDLVSITSLYRTGPIQAKFPQQFIRNRREGTIEYVHDSLEPMLSTTWGVILYQEQVMEIAEKCAGFDMIQVDEIKEAIKHKRSALMKSLRPKFLRGCRATVGMTKQQAGKIWDAIEGYSGYSYNRSHAVAYTMLTYQTARLKYLYPVEYHAALLATVEATKDNVEKRSVYLTGATRRNIRILPPCVNDSRAVTAPDGREDAIRFGFTDLSGIGPSQAKKILAGRPESGYASVDEVAEAVRNVGVMKVLKDCGALLALGERGSRVEQEKLLHWTSHDPMADLRSKFELEYDAPQIDGFLEEDDDEKWGGGVDCVLIGAIFQTNLKRTKNGKPYMQWKIRWSPTESWDIHLWSECEHLWEKVKHGDIIKVHGKWSSKFENVSISNPRMIARLVDNEWVPYRASRRSA